MASDATLNGLDGPTDDELEALEADGTDASAPVRQCRGCSAPIAGHVSKQWCSETCRRGHRTPGPAAASTKRQRSQNGHIPPAEPDGLIRALVNAGATVTSWQVAYGGRDWIITRSANGKEHP